MSNMVHPARSNIISIYASPMKMVFRHNGPRKPSGYAEQNRLSNVAALAGVTAEADRHVDGTCQQKVCFHGGSSRRQ